MRAAIYNPYLDTLGGGERYSMAVADVLVSKGYEVDVQWKSSNIKTKLEMRFGIDLKNVKFIPDIRKGEHYDLCFWVSDGSIPLLRARNNILHFQVPFTGVDGKSLLNKMKLFRVNKIICNSRFTKSFIDREYAVNSIVIYPAVDVTNIKPKRKKNIILSVGRFSQLTQAKNQDVLISAFKKLVKKEMGDWRLILAGGSEIGGKEYVENLKKQISNYPIEIVENPDYKTLKDLYGFSKLFWSASGFGIDEKKDPKKVEHFGISVTEALSAKAIPLVFNAGGFKEIIKEGDNGFLWNTISQLVSKSKKITKDVKLSKTIADKCLKTSKQYSYERFKKEYLQII
jgi:glycosyltransferase involved in cell wall biosynthesis